MATPPLTDSRYSAIKPSRTRKRLMPSITTRCPSNCGIFDVKLDNDQAYPIAPSKTGSNISQR